jgi:hypothetical protein
MFLQYLLKFPLSFRSSILTINTLDLLLDDFFGKKLKAYKTNTSVCECVCERVRVYYVCVYVCVRVFMCVFMCACVCVKY